MSCADVIGNGCAVLTIVFANKPALISQSEMYETCVSDDDALQALQFGAVDRATARLANHVPPALNALLGRIFALDLKARSRILEPQKRRSAGKEVCG